MFGEIVIILVLGLAAETNFAVFPEFENAIIAFTDGLYAKSFTDCTIDLIGSF